MNFSLSMATCLALALMMGGCAEQPQPSLSQKPRPSQTQSAGSSYPQQGHSVISVAPPPSAASSGVMKAAILLPLSGQNAALGQAMLNAAQQAVFDASSDHFALEPRDTEGAGGAAEAAHAAIAAGAQIIIGPLFAADVPPVKKVAQSGGLSVLPLSSDISFAEPDIYVMGLAPPTQVERVVSYAALHGARHFAALVPTTPYGALVGQVYTDAVTRAGGAIVAYQTYDAALHNLSDRVKDIAVHRNEIDALFLPEESDDLKRITDLLAAAGWKEAHAHLLGTGLWDIGTLAKENPALVGGWYAAPDPALRQAFIAAYATAYGQQPPRLATLAYDATALVADLAKHGAHYDDAALTNPNGFVGLDGLFRLMPNGKVERALAVQEVTADGAKIIDPAPTNFINKNKSF